MALINCSECSNQVSDKADSCPKCGAPITNSKCEAPPVKRAPEVKCPRCGSTSVTANKKGFGVGRAIAGDLIAGPVGLLAGGMSSNKVIITCLACGHKFKPGDHLKRQQNLYLASLRKKKREGTITEAEAKKLKAHDISQLVVGIIFLAILLLFLKACA